MLQQEIWVSTSIIPFLVESQSHSVPMKVLGLFGHQQKMEAWRISLAAEAINARFFLHKQQLLFASICKKSQIFSFLCLFAALHVRRRTANQLPVLQSVPSFYLKLVVLPWTKLECNQLQLVESICKCRKSLKLPKYLYWQPFPNLLRCSCNM